MVYKGDLTNRPIGKGKYYSDRTIKTYGRSRRAAGVPWLTRRSNPVLAPKERFFKDYKRLYQSRGGGIV